MICLKYIDSIKIMVHAILGNRIMYSLANFKIDVWTRLSTTAYDWHRQNAILCTFNYHISTKSQKCWLDITQILFTTIINRRTNIEEKLNFQEEKIIQRQFSPSQTLRPISKYNFSKVVSLPDSSHRITEFLTSAAFYIFFPFSAILCPGSTLLELGLKLWATTTWLIVFWTPRDP